jgi:hypothetical protein
MSHTVPVTVANESPAGALSTAPPRFRSKAADAIDTQHARRAVILMANLDLSSKERRCRVTRRPMRERGGKASEFKKQKQSMFQKDS